MISLKLLRRIFIFSFMTLTCFGTMISLLHAADYNPKSLSHGLFDVSEFVRVRRNARADRLNKDVYYLAPSSSSSMISSPNDTRSLLEKSTDIRFEDLSSTEREALRKQLRVRACPENAHLGYKKLCESLLKLQAPRSPRTGIMSDKLLR